MNQDPKWLQECIKASTRQQSRFAFKSFYEVIFQKKKNSDFIGLGEVMRSLLDHGETMHTMLLIANLRLTCWYSQEIEQWAEMRDETARIFDSRNLNTKALLRGLFER